MNADQANAVYDVLMAHAGARESWRSDFIHVVTKGGSEYRFQGSLGFGGKYRQKTNKVDCYQEDETPERLATIEATNAALAQLVDNGTTSQT